MNIYRKLKTVRVCVQLVAAVAIAVAVVMESVSIFERMQVFEAIAASSAVWLLTWGALTLIFGRIYCSTVCPSGALMDAASWLTRRMRGGYSYSPPRSQIGLSLVVVVAVCAICGLSFVPDALDPCKAYTRIVAACARPLAIGIGGLAVASAVLALFVTVAARRGRLICNTVCPVGALLGIGSRDALYHPDINTDLCVGCGRCADVCPSECIDLDTHTVDASRCVVCFDCMAACPNEAITYRRGRHQLSTPLMRRVADASGTSAFGKPAPASTDCAGRDGCGSRCRECKGKESFKKQYTAK